MKKTRFLQYSLIAVVLLVAGNTAYGAHHVEVHVLPESGIGIEFSIRGRGDGITSADSPARLNVEGVSASKTAERLIHFELPESGQELSFPMTARETAEAESLSDRLIVSRLISATRIKNSGETYEQPESGILIAIP